MHEHQAAQRHLHGVGAADELQQLVDDEGHDQDVERRPTTRSRWPRGSPDRRRRSSLALPQDRIADAHDLRASRARRGRARCARPTSTHAATAAAVPHQALAERRPSSDLADEALARRADQDRPAQRREAREPPQHLQAVGRVLGEADARDRRSAGSRSTPARAPRAEGLAQLGRDLAPCTSP